jgi:hypothetical protein
MCNRSCSQEARVEDLRLVLLIPALISNTSSGEVDDCIDSAKWFEIYEAALRVPLDLIGGYWCSTNKTLDSMPLALEVANEGGAD